MLYQFFFFNKSKFSKEATLIKDGRLKDGIGLIWKGVFTVQCSDRLGTLESSLLKVTYFQRKRSFD